MEQQRLMLFVALAFISYLIFSAWQQDHALKESPTTRSVPTQTAPKAKAPTDNSHDDEIPVAEATSRATPASSTVPTEQATNIFKDGQAIHIITDELEVTLNTVGGDIRELKLLDYPTKLHEKDNPFVLLNDKLPRIFVGQSGFTGKKVNANSIISAPNHLTTYTVDRTRYVLDKSKDSMDVNLYWRSPEGVNFTKTYTFYRGSHKIDLKQTINNQANKNWRGNTYYQLQRTNTPEADKPKFTHTYLGGVIYSPKDRYEKIKFKEIKETKLNRNITDGWVAMIQHYFLAAWIPAKDKAETFYSSYKPKNELYTLGFRDEHETIVAPGASHTFKTTFYGGPKDQKKLEKIAKGLELTVDYGVLTVIAKPIFWLLTNIHAVVGNWGWAIIFLTILIKGMFYKLSEASYKSMAKMRGVQPRMAAMKERFAGDRSGMNKAMMEMYKKEKINPLGGCLPIVVQIPVFIALYWVLLESVELRQAPWIFWIRDLSIADPYYILPLLMGISMFIQQKLNPTPIDPIQAKVMMILPVVFSVFFMFFPAGLVLYWVINNTLSISQQWYITNKVVNMKK